METSDLPVVMTIAGNDPTGGAGLSADTETIISQGCHAVPIVSCITIQDTCEVFGVAAIDSQILIQQARAVLEDLPVDVIKLGLLGSEDSIEAVNSILLDYPDIPVVFDPVLASGGSGQSLVDNDAKEAMFELLVPLTTIMTPNSHEVLELIHEADNSHAAAMALLERGCQYVLVTGTHENTPKVINRLYGEQKEINSYAWERLPHTYHGSGCTLSAALAGLIAQGVDIENAVIEAQEFTWHSLKHGFRLGMGQHHPNRLFWASDENAEENAKDK